MSCDLLLEESIEREINQFCGKCSNADYAAALSDAVARLDSKKSNLRGCPNTRIVYDQYLSNIEGGRARGALLYQDSVDHLLVFKAVADNVSSALYQLAGRVRRRSDNLLVQLGTRDDSAFHTDESTLDIQFRFKPFVERDHHSFSFMTYQNTPFAFVHEYVSHVLPEKIMYRQFSEGWLLWTAQQFFTASRTFPQLSWHHHARIHAFVSRCLFEQGASLAPGKGYNNASQFYKLITDNGLSQSLFRDITIEAALRPPEYGGCFDFHRDLLHTLVDHMASAQRRPRLLPLLRGYSTFDDFWDKLV